MSWLSDLPVQRKLRFSMLTTSAVALTLACGFFLIFEYVGYRSTMSQNVAALARVTAGNSTAAIAFSNTADAHETLDALRPESQILAAALYDAEGRLFAFFTDDMDHPPPATAPSQLGGYIEGGLVVHVEPVVQEGRRLGTLYVRATLAELYRRMRMYAAVVAGVLAASVILAWILASILQRTIARPIVELAATAGAISHGSDYSLRARRYGDDELGRLTDAFNTMLERTQKAVGALRESEARFRLMADSAPMLMWLADTIKARTWLNQRWLEFVGRSMEQELGDGWLQNVHPDDRERVARMYAAAFDLRQPFQMEYQMRRYDGVYRWLLDHGIPRFNAGGEFAGYIGSCIDVTDRKLAEEEVALARDRALAASRAKDDFLARLSHELRTPLNPVLLVSSDAAVNPELPEAVRADFEMIAKHVSLEARLIDDLLDLTKIVRGKLTLERKVCDLHTILRDAVGTVWPDIESKRIRFTFDLAAAEAQVFGDPVRLQQVFWNLLKNAVKFTPDGGTVRLETRVADPDRVAVSITDSGLGMTPTELNRVFEAFSQGDHAEGSASHRFGGLGLGLAISRMLVELHSGSISAASPGRNHGATFEVNLPLVAEAPPEAAAVTEVPADRPANGSPRRMRGDASAGPDRERVLVVEDHGPTCRTLAQLLSRRGYQVDAVSSVAAARETASGRHFAFVISDIGLPDGDGYALMAELRQGQPDLRGVALTGYGAEQDVARSRAAGFLDHLTKPINVDKLDEALSRLQRNESRW
jgi:PAS domain S-box-containing protein